VAIWKNKSLSVPVNLVKTRMCKPPRCGAMAWSLLLMAATVVMAPLPGGAVGSWQTITSFPYSGPGHMLLLTDGTVMVQNNGGTGWYALKPDTHGHYLNGNWSTLNSMANSREYYASQVLQNGKVLVGGGESGSGGSAAEVYDPIADLWTPTPAPGAGLGDSESILLANGEVMAEPVGFFMGSAFNTLLYNPAANTWSGGPTDLAYQDEATWVKLPDNSVLTVDIYTGGTTSERYIPYYNTNTWIEDAGLPVSMTGGKSEVGGAFMLADGRAFWLGGSGFTAFYTPSGDASNGKWKQGPNMPYYSGPDVYTDTNNNYEPTNYSGLLTTRDTPAAMMINGKIICQLAAGPFHNQVWFYEYDPSVTNFVAAPCPSSTTPGAPYLVGTNGTPSLSDATSMLDLPDGTVLYNDTVTLYIYTPDGSALAAGKPTILNTSWNADGSLHLTGTLFNGISQGASFGDDAQQDSNYPLVRFTDGGGNVTYGRTYNWSSTGVQTGGQIVSTECKVPSGISGSFLNYSMRVVANGNASDPVNFEGPVWVDFNYTGPQNGSYPEPYEKMAAGVSAVPTNGTIIIRTAGSSSETMIISKPVTITAVAGPGEIGH
jgi:hypothetical protein